MTDHIKCYAITRSALKALLPTADSKSRDVDPLWFDWRLSLPPKSSASTSLTRFMVVDDTRYDEVKRNWVEVANRVGVLPVLVATMDDEPPGQEWPVVNDAALERAINAYEIRKCKGSELRQMDTRIPELLEEPVFEIVPVEAQLVAELERLRDELLMPERGVLDAWVGVLTGDREVYWGHDAHPIAWMAYADGLHKWVAQPQLYENHLRRLGELPYLSSIPTVELDWNDFEYRPQVDLIRTRLVERLYIPCKWAPFCGIGFDGGEARPFGLLIPDSQGEWLFGAQLRNDLTAVLVNVGSRQDVLAAGLEVIREGSGRLVEKAVNIVKTANEGVGKVIAEFRTLIAIEVFEASGSHAARADHRQVSVKPEWQRHVLVTWEQEGNVWTLQGRALGREIEVELSCDNKYIEPMSLLWGDINSEIVDRYPITRDEEGRWLVKDLYVALARLRAKQIRKAVSPMEQSQLLPTVEMSKE